MDLSFKQLVHGRRHTGGDLQRALGRTSSAPVMMFNPPWLPLLAAPLLVLPFAFNYFVFLGFYISHGDCAA